MNSATRKERLPVAAFVSGVLAALCGVLTLLTRGDLYPIGVIVFLVLAVALVCWSWLANARPSPKPNANSLSGWALALAAVAFVLGILFVPYV